mmetsp:Transcript_31388/g.98425  ORF Transcript_31388/g.98425 Transcript_31388/m.98425 type:complete len:236 (-) Transcript_31388:911-1618(-)
MDPLPLELDLRFQLVNLLLPVGDGLDLAAHHALANHRRRRGIRGQVDLGLPEGEGSILVRLYERVEGRDILHDLHVLDRRPRQDVLEHVLDLLLRAVLLRDAFDEHRVGPDLGHFAQPLEASGQKLPHCLVGSPRRVDHDKPDHKGMEPIEGDLVLDVAEGQVAEVVLSSSIAAEKEVTGGFDEEYGDAKDRHELRTELGELNEHSMVQGYVLSNLVDGHGHGGTEPSEERISRL